MSLEDLHYFEIYCKAKAIKTVWNWPKDRQIDPWNRTENRLTYMFN